MPPKPQRKKLTHRRQHTHQHHIPECITNCHCMDCNCRNIPLDQMDFDEDDRS